MKDTCTEYHIFMHRSIRDLGALTYSEYFKVFTCEIVQCTCEFFCLKLFYMMNKCQIQCEAKITVDI